MAHSFTPLEYRASTEQQIGHRECRPASLFTWDEVLPLVGGADRKFLTDLMTKCGVTLRDGVGSSDRLFRLASRSHDQGVLHQWMKLLSDCDLGQFLDHVVPFLRNISGFHYGERKRSLLAMFDEIWHRPPDESPSRIDRILGMFDEIWHRPPDESPSRIDRKLGMEFPASVMLEITQSCNFACRMCSSRTGGFLAHRTMPVEAFDEFVRVFAPYAKVLRINGYGETSIVPGLARYLDCLDHHHYSESREIITNLSANDAVYLDLHARGFTQLVSWDAASQAVFEHIRVGARYDELLPRLRKLGKAVRPHPERLGLLMTVQERNLPQVVPVTRLAVEVGAGLVIFNMIKEEKGSPWMEKRFQEIRRIFSEAQSMAAAAGLIVSIPDHVGSQRLRTPQVKRTSGSFCDRPWRELFIRYDGEAQVCNMFNPFSYGQLTPPGAKQGVEQRFHILWSGPNARLFRRLINSEHPHPYCKECYYLYG